MPFSFHGTACARLQPGFPAAMHPPPLLRMPQNQALQRLVVRLSVAANLLIVVLAYDGRQRLFEAQHVPAAALPPRGGGNHGRAGRARNEREATERTRRMTEELDRDAVAAGSMLIEGEQNDVAGSQPLHEQIERALFRQRAKAQAQRPLVDKSFQPARLERTAHEMKVPMRLGKLRNASR